MKKLIFLNALFLVLFILPAIAQIEKEITSYVDSTEIMVINGRKMIIVKLTEKDDEKVKEIYHYLDSLTVDKINTPFDYTEYLYINLLMGDWNTLTAYMKEYSKSIDIVPYLNDDQLKDLLIDRVIEMSDSLLSNSKSSMIDEPGKSAIELLVHLTKNDTPDPKYYRLLNEYNRKYRKSEYMDFINSYLPAPQPKLAISFSLGSGMIFPTNKLDDSFSHRQSFNLSMDINIQKIFTSLYIQGASLKLEVPFMVVSDAETIDFYQGDIFDYVEIGLKGGYFLVRSNRFHIAPYVTAISASLQSTLYQSPEDDDLEYKPINSFSCGPGIHTEMKLLEIHTKNPYADTNDKYISIKADAGYNYITKYEDKYFKGNTCYFSVALVYGLGIF